jgi:hypothetical protein
MTKFLHFNVVLNPKSSLKTRKMYQSRTVAVDPVSAVDIASLAQLFLSAQYQMTVQLNIGVTFLSLKDRYSKKEGRLQAIQRMTLHTMEIEGITVNATHVFIQLKEYMGISLLLRLNKATGFSTVTGSLSLGA